MHKPRQESLTRCFFQGSGSIDYGLHTLGKVQPAKAKTCQTCEAQILMTVTTAMMIQCVATCVGLEELEMPRPLLLTAVPDLCLLSESQWQIQDSLAGKESASLRQMGNFVKNSKIQEDPIQHKVVIR